MVFNSLTYLIFLLVCVALYWVLPTRVRLWMLFIASLLFYGFWRFDFLFIMLFSALVDYVVAILLSRVESPGTRKTLLATSLFLNLGLLAYFKYLQFAVDSVWWISSYLGGSFEHPVLHILLPLGISFYTFQTISYTIDVYRRQIAPIRDFLMYGLYVVFFPQLVAGPILRESEVVPQLVQRPQFKWEFLTEGIKRILMGLFLKVCCADNIAGFVNEGFAINPSMLSVIDVWTLAFLFGFQIYFDFSAYSHIAIGSARLMGIDFPENFNFPYLAVSPKDFWSRWHISLSSWIRDYLYFPLCGMKFGSRSQGGMGNAIENRQASNRTFALFLTWAIMGMWHGAGVNFLLWGIFHALVIHIFRVTEPVRNALPKYVRIIGGWCLTLPTMMLGWIFFRAANAHHALELLSSFVHPSRWFLMGLRENYYLIAAGVLLLVIVTAGVVRFIAPRLYNRPVLATVVMSGVYATMFALIAPFLRPVEQFIYFQF